MPAKLRSWEGVLLAVVFLMVLPQPLRGELKIEELLQTLKDAELEIRSLSVTNRVEVLHKFFPESPGQEINLQITERVIVDGTGRCRVESKGQSFRYGSPPEVYGEIALGVYDGQEMRQMSGSTKYRQGLVTSLRSDISMRFDPLHATTHYFFQPVRAILAEDGQIVGETDWEGRKVLVAETEPKGKQDKRKYRFLIDPAANFAIVKRSIAIQFPPHERWIEYTRIACYDYQELHPGVWLPYRAVHESFDPTAQHAQDGTEPPLSWRWHIKMEDWEVNPELPDSLFQLTFSPGVYVNDKIAGSSYKVAGISDELLRHQAEEGKAWHDSETKVAIAHRKILVIVNLLVVVVIVSFIGIRQLRFRRPV